jgi:N6-adenosine-specific RNA methylase IME4
MWIVDCYMDRAHELFYAWGYKYRDVAFIWVKLTKKTNILRMGLGPNTRKNAEQCWMAIRQELNVFQDLGEVILLIKFLVHLFVITLKNRIN